MNLIRGCVYYLMMWVCCIPLFIRDQIERIPKKTDAYLPKHMRQSCFWKEHQKTVNSFRDQGVTLDWTDEGPISRDNINHSYAFMYPQCLTGDMIDAKHMDTK